MMMGCGGGRGKKEPGRGNGSEGGERRRIQRRSRVSRRGPVTMVHSRSAPEESRVVSPVPRHRVEHVGRKDRSRR